MALTRPRLIVSALVLAAAIHFACARVAGPVQAQSLPTPTPGAGLRQIVVVTLAPSPTTLGSRQSTPSVVAGQQQPPSPTRPPPPPPPPRPVAVWLFGGLAAVVGVIVLLRSLRRRPATKAATQLPPRIQTVADPGRQIIELDSPALIVGAVFIPEENFEWDAEASK